MLCYEQSGNWSSEADECHFKINFNINIDYPIELTSQDLTIYVTIETYLNQLTTNFFNDWLSGSDTPKYDEPWFLTVEHDIYRFSDEIVTVAFHVEEIPGYRDEVPSAFITMKTFTFNESTSDVIEWADLFRDTVDPMVIIAPIVEAELIDILSAYDDHVDIWGSANPDNYTWFALSEDELILFFSPWMITPDYIAMEADPIIAVHIALEDIADILDPTILPVVTHK